MADYILRGAAIAEIKDEAGCDSCWAATREMCKTMCHTRKKIDRIVAISAADVRPVVRGKWENETGYIFSERTERLYCPVCGSFSYFGTLTRRSFCPNCGADMRGEQCSPLQEGEE